jgi:hypothetical protein
VEVRCDATISDVVGTNTCLKTMVLLWHGNRAGPIWANCGHLQARDMSKKFRCRQNLLESGEHLFNMHNGQKNHMHGGCRSTPVDRIISILS